MSETVNYYCPLKIQMSDENDFDLVEYENSVAHPYVTEIKKMLQKEMSFCNSQKGMMEYFDENESIAEKIIYAAWDVEMKNGELYGVIRTEQTYPLSDEEKKIWLDWCTGQSSDGNDKCLSMRSVGGKLRRGGEFAEKRFA